MSESGIIQWKDKEVGRVSNMRNDMWYIGANWLPIDPEHSPEFIEKASKLDGKQVMSYPEKGILAHLLYDGPSSARINVLIVSLTGSEIVMRMINDETLAYVTRRQSRRRWRLPWTR